jgi:uncharacterized protein (DUF1501 family)
MPTRRRILAGLGAAAGLVALPRIAFAAAPTDHRLVVVILRGALDGLAAVPPWRDPYYAEQRGSLALEPPGPAGVLDLDGYFGLHPALAPLHDFYRKGELIALHAVATPYRERSHFDGQDLLENGSLRPRGARDGWLNRALAEFDGSRRLGLAVGQTVPLMLNGGVPVATWAPSRLPDPAPDFVARVAALWRDDTLLGPALAEGLRAQAMSQEVLGPERDAAMMPGGGRALAPYAGAVGKLLAAADGPRVAVFEVGGWDTHAQQGRLTGRLAAALDNLGRGLAALAQGLGGEWRRTAVIAISEFGRTVAVNGSGGTDHGTAGCALLAGGAVTGGRVLADWPGLAPAKLHEGRDLKPTLDARSLFKGVLRDHLGIDRAALDARVFPASAGVPALDRLIRA